jgi:hypothetical protein
MKRLILVLPVLMVASIFVSQQQVNLLNHELITYKVTMESRTAFVSLQFNPLKGGAYQAVYTVSFTVEGELDYEAFAVPYMYLMIAYVYNPAFLPFFQMIDLDNPSSVNLYGVKIIYEKDEKVGKYTGRRFSYYANDQKLFSWVVAKQIELPIKFEIPEQGYVAELVEFRKR